MTLAIRQTAGVTSRQKQDAPEAVASGRAAALSSAFLRENLEQLGLPALTAEVVSSARSSAELTHLKDGTPVLRREGRLLGHPPDEAELRRLCDGDAETMFVVFGLGLGHTARALRAHTSAPILVYEPDPGVLRSVLELGPLDLPPIDITCTTHDLSQAWPKSFGNRRSVVFVPTPGYVDAFADTAAHLRATLAQLVQRSRVNDATHRLRAREWISDLLANVELLGEHTSFLALARKYRGLPAFVVGAGPSLGKNGHLLVQAQKKGIVFAVNTSARALASYGVEPHVVACMESIDVSHLLEGTGFIDKAVRAFSLTAHPKTVRTGRGPLLPVYESLPQISGPLASLTGYAGLPVSGSVSTLAFSLAQRLGCSPIVFVGQDLAYTGGRAYARGTAYEDSRVVVSDDRREIRLNWSETLTRTHNVGGRKMHESEPLSETTAWGGTEKVLTGISFTAVRTWLESAAVVLEREAPEVELINATEGGARIHGFRERSLEEVLAELPERNITPERIAEEAARAAAPLDVTRIAAWADEQAALVAAARHGARRVRRLAEATAHSARSSSGDVSRRLQKLTAAEHALRGLVSRAALLDAWSWAAVDELMEQHTDAPDEDAKQSAVRALAFEARLGRVVEQSTIELESELKKLSQRLRARSTGG